MTSEYVPTPEQQAVIVHPGSAFVTACPGGGKTRTLVERARQLLTQPMDRRGVAFLSFTNGAVDELEARLRVFGLLPSPLFPSFIGTFDRFLWQFLIAPFGIPGCGVVPHLVPDKNQWGVVPFEGAQSLPLSCFDRTTGAIDPALAKEKGFDVAERQVKAYETRALNMIRSAREKGWVDFEDVRACALGRLDDTVIASRLGAALAARFREIIVDEAQDCNPADLDIVQWLRESGIVVKVICDPQQAIYAFRGGVTDELLKFANTFPEKDQLTLSGNFRSTPAICAGVVAFRPPALRTNPDKALGRHKHDMTPIYLLAYAGNGVSAAVGSAFSELVSDLNIPLQNAPVVASTHASARKAIGQPSLGETSHMTLLLAQAAMSYHFAFAIGNRREALADLHRVILLIEGRIEELGSYHAHLASGGQEDGGWRSRIIVLANQLQIGAGETPDQWLKKARALLEPGLSAGLNVSSRLRSHTDLPKALQQVPAKSAPARSIHSVKGMEFPAVCVVMTSKTAGNILDLLHGQAGSGADEDVRKLYVGASRAERLLAFAVPKNSAERLRSLLMSQGCSVQLRQIKAK